MDDNSPKLDNDMPSESGLEEHAEELSRVDEGDISADAEFNNNVPEKEEVSEDPVKDEAAHDEDTNEETHDAESHDEEVGEEHHDDEPNEGEAHDEESHDSESHDEAHDDKHEEESHEESHEEDKHEEQTDETPGDESTDSESGADKTDELVTEGEAHEDTKEETDNKDEHEDVVDDTLEAAPVDVQKDAATDEVASQESASNKMAAVAAMSAMSDTSTKVPVEPVIPVKPAEQAKRSKTPMILGIVLGLAAVLCVVAFIFLGMNDKPASNQPEKKPETSHVDGEDQEHKIENNKLSDFDISFLKTHESGVNTAYSPMSIKYALSMLKDGADGESKKQIEDVLGSYNPKLYVNNNHLAVMNAIFVKDSFKDFMREDYLNSIKEKYNANAIYDPFNNAATINDWVYKNTLSLIPDLLKDDDLQYAEFVLANTVAIDMEWENMIMCIRYEKPTIGCTEYEVEPYHEDYFDKVGTFEGPVKLDFNGGKTVEGLKIGATINDYDIINDLGEEHIRNTVKAAYEEWLETDEAKGITGYQELETSDEYVETYMKELGMNYGAVQTSTNFLMHADDEVKMFAKDLQNYEGTQLQYIGIMPVSEDIDSYIKGLTADKITNTVKKLKTISQDNFKNGKITRITGAVPQFNFKYSVEDMNEKLEGLGIKDIFSSDTANLSGMTSEDGVYIHKVVHQTKIDFSNIGIKAAGATAVLGGRGAGASFDYLWDVPVEEIDLTFNKPFVFLIRDKSTGEVWFMGAVYEPTAYSE